MRSTFAKWRAIWPAKQPILLILWVTLLSLAAEETLFWVRRGAPPTFYWNQFFGWDRLMAWVFVALMVAAVFGSSLSRHIRAPRLETFLARHIRWILGASLLLYLALARYISAGFAYTPDELCALLQAQTFALGKVTPQVAPELVSWIVPRAFQGDLIYISETTGRYSPLYWPGYAFLLTPFAFFGLEWLANPLITTLSLGLWWKLAVRFTGDERAGLWAVVFALLSSAIVFNAVTFFSMPAHLLFNLLFCWFFTANRRASFFWAGFIGGFALILHNPLPHLSFVLPWLFWAYRHRRPHFLWLLLGYLVVAPAIGIGWSLHLGEFRQGNLAATPNFGEVLARIAYAFQPPDAALLQVRLAALIKLLLWACPGSVVLAWLGWRDVSRKKQLKPVENDSPHRDLSNPDSSNPDSSNRDAPIRTECADSAAYLWLLGASMVSNFVIYLFVRYDEGHAWGFRYLHQSWLAIPLLAAAYVTSHRARFPVGFFAPRPQISTARFAAILCLLTLMLVLPLRIDQGRQFLQAVREARPVTTTAAPVSITFISESYGDASAAIRNDPFLQNKAWHLRSRGSQKNAALARRWLLHARRTKAAPWGEMWTGTGFSRSPSPVLFPAQ